jgi:hypothetical protein
VSVSPRDLDRQPALSTADIGKGLVLAPGEGCRDGPRSREADARHGTQEQLEPGRVGVHGREQVGLAVLGLVLGQAGLERVREVAPEAVQAPIHHLEDATHVGRLGAVEIELGFGGIGVAPVREPLEHAERHKRVQEVMSTTLVEAQVFTHFRKT